MHLENRIHMRVKTDGRPIPIMVFYQDEKQIAHARMAFVINFSLGGALIHCLNSLPLHQEMIMTKGQSRLRFELLREHGGFYGMRFLDHEDACHLFYLELMQDILMLGLG